MAIVPGTMLSRYRLVEKIGEGGMGVVWKATDTRLGRDVGLKFLSDTLAPNPERLARFEREARLLASLNHSGHRSNLTAWRRRTASASWRWSSCPERIWPNG